MYKPLVERNIQITQLRRDGVPIKKVAALYELTEGRISQIEDWVERYERGEASHKQNGNGRH